MPRFLLAAVLAIALPGAARAQAPAHLSGTVTDESGGVLPGVTVTASARDGRVLATTTSDGNGAWSIDGLPAVPLKLSFQLDGFSPAASEIALMTGARAPHRQRLSIAAQSENVTVVGTAPPPPVAPTPIVVPLPARPTIVPVEEHARESVCGPTKLTAAAESFGTIRARRFGAEHGLYFAGDELVIDRGTADGLAIARNYVARRTFRTPAGSGAATGQHAAGLVQVVAADEHSAFAVVVYACDEVMRGDTLAAFKPEPALPPEPPGTPAFDDAARILFGDEGQLVGVPHRLMVIDRGETQGVRPGQRFTLFRPPRNSSAPPAVVGDAVAVSVRHDSATIRIESASDAITFSDLAAPQRHPAGKKGS